MKIFLKRPIDRGAGVDVKEATRAGARYREAREQGVMNCARGFATRRGFSIGGFGRYLGGLGEFLKVMQ